MNKIQLDLSSFASEDEPIKLYNFRDLCKEIPNTSYLTHNFHKYPAKFIPQIPHYFIKNYTKESDWVHDPFGGCGTTILEAKLLNRNSSMIELNPLGCLISKVITTPIPSNDLRNEYNNLKQTILASSQIPIITDFPNINHWFDDKVIRDLEIIKGAINNIKIYDIRDFFKITLSSILRIVSKADPKIAAPLITKKMRQKITDGRQINTFKTFFEASKVNILAMNNFSEECIKKKITATSNIYNQDARESLKEQIKYDMVITSPPYINAQEYIRIHKLEMYWLDLIDYNLKTKLEKDLIGTERITSNKYNNLNLYGIEELDDILNKIFSIDKKRAFIIYKFFKDMDKVIKNIYNMLKVNGFFILVIGNNNIRNYHINNHIFLKEICIKNGFNFKSLGYDEIKARALMTKRRVTDKFMSREWVLIFQK